MCSAARSDSGTRPTCSMAPTRVWVVASAGSAPKTETRPEVGHASPKRSLIAVVFPAPFGPSNEVSLGYWESADDAVFARLGRLAVVADGMGGHEGGQIASHIAVEAIQQAYSNAADADPQKVLIAALQEAHHRIQRRANEDPE